ncbi:Phr family secreted Rap phosphatase inhibitor [Bacillus sp. 491mf]|uniref:Phr family secreted Rap phosphatase inhibitor n=1 Tax=Bacillus TaxID=1386 RepID=UPI0005569CA1|nr:MULTISPECIES: Phr family secreted Rap phosphatase inhibitor [unclassified Bacillus (in: firmicutes)]SFD52374.1 Phr family secreted Rap phosphatase inhibitor [Bacillus sp. 491mf]
MKKLGAITVGLSVVGVLSFGLSNSFETQQATHADHFISKPDNGSVQVQESHADLPAPAYNKGDTPVQQA